MDSSLLGVERNPSPKKPPLDTIKEWFALCDLEAPHGVRDRAIFELIYGSGPRSGEARALSITTPSRHTANQD